MLGWQLGLREAYKPVLELAESIGRLEVLNVPTSPVLEFCLDYGGELLRSTMESCIVMQTVQDATFTWWLDGLGE